MSRLYDARMLDDQSAVGRWISELRVGDDEAARQLWQRYWARLVDLAGKKLPGHVRREFDEEDVAVSAFHSLCRGVRGGRFPDLTEDGLWPLLLLITSRKARERLRVRQTKKRGGGDLHGESVFGANGGDDMGGIDRVIGEAPSPEFAAEIAEESQRFLDLLDDPTLRSLALLKLEGHVNTEIADLLGCTSRTVERRLALIRRLWSATGLES